MDIQKGQEVYVSLPPSYLGMTTIYGTTIVKSKVLGITDDSAIVEFDVELDGIRKSILVQVYLDLVFKNVKEVIEYIHKRYDDLDPRPTTSNRENQDLERS